MMESSFSFFQSGLCIKKVHKVLLSLNIGEVKQQEMFSLLTVPSLSSQYPDNRCLWLSYRITLPMLFLTDCSFCLLFSSSHSWRHITQHLNFHSENPQTISLIYYSFASLVCCLGSDFWCFRYS